MAVEISRAEPKMGPLATQIEREGRESLAGADRREVKAQRRCRNTRCSIAGRKKCAGDASPARGLCIRVKYEPLAEQARRRIVRVDIGLGWGRGVDTRQGIRRPRGKHLRNHYIAGLTCKMTLNEPDSSESKTHLNGRSTDSKLPILARSQKRLFWTASGTVGGALQ
jgi:hypothetical protein